VPWYLLRVPGYEAWTCSVGEKYRRIRAIELVGQRGSLTMADKEKKVDGRADGSMGIQVRHEERDAPGFGQNVTGGTLPSGRRSSDRW